MQDQKVEPILTPGVPAAGVDRRAIKSVVIVLILPSTHIRLLASGQDQRVFIENLIRLPGKHPIGSPARRDDEEAGGYEGGGRRRPPRRPRRDSGHGRQGERRQGAGSPPRPAPPASFCQICWRDSSGGLIVPGAGTGAR